MDALATSSEAQPEAPFAPKMAKAKKPRALLNPRWFLMRNVHEPSMRLLQSRHTLSVLRGPMTKVEIQRALVRRRGAAASE